VDWNSSISQTNGVLVLFHYSNNVVWIETLIPPHSLASNSLLSLLEQRSVDWNCDVWKEQYKFFTAGFLFRPELEIPREPAFTTRTT